MTTTRVEKLNELKKVLSSDLLACDVMISILTSAALSFKRDSLLVPFPKCYLKDSVKDFEKLVSCQVIHSNVSDTRLFSDGRPRKNSISGRVPVVVAER